MIYGDSYKKREFDKYNYLISGINASQIKNFFHYIQMVF